MSELRRSLRRVLRRANRVPDPLRNGLFRLRHRHLRGRPKILYALTPPPRLRNVGDHAQVVAIRRWLARHWPERPVLEIDKDEVQRYLPALRALAGPDDLVILHSGGNLGDRGLWSERGRRAVIEAFPGHRIVSLPQTIHFSDTPKGQRQRARSEAIYARHPALTVLGRDPRSGELAGELFPRARSGCAPDFVLSLPPQEAAPAPGGAGILLCLRRDAESVLDAKAVDRLRAALPGEVTLFDTTLDSEIAREEREAVLERTLALFAAHAAVVTDRYHGLIFAVLCRKPTVVLPTVDHKLTSALTWFEALPFVRLAQDVAEVPGELARCQEAPRSGLPDWNARHFDPLARWVRSSDPGHFGWECAS